MSEKAYYSNNKNSDFIDINLVVLVIENDYKPYYYINLHLLDGSKFEWQYFSKEMRDKGIKKIRELRDKIKSSNNTI